MFTDAELCSQFMAGTIGPPTEDNYRAWLRFCKAADVDPFDLGFSEANLRMKMSWNSAADECDEEITSRQIALIRGLSA